MRKDNSIYVGENQLLAEYRSILRDFVRTLQYHRRSTLYHTGQYCTVIPYSNTVSIMEHCVKRKNNVPMYYMHSQSYYSITFISAYGIEINLAKCFTNVFSLAYTSQVECRVLPRLIVQSRVMANHSALDLNPETTI